MPDKFHLCGIGNAIVDVLSFTNDSFLAQQSLIKGTMALIDEARAEGLYNILGQSQECSGGSVANTLAGAASLGARCAFIGKVKADQLGDIFRHDLRAVGVAFDTQAAVEGPATARCLICVTPDGERTMNTYLGACAQVHESDIDETLIAASMVTYIEGYLWDQPHAKSAIRKAISAAHNAKKRVAFTLSDTFCVERHREEIMQLVKNDIDILFANEGELKSLFQTQDFDAACAQLRGLCDIAAVTRGERGSVVITESGITPIPTEPVTKVVDTTGAGDLYASGFLYGLTRGWDLPSCAKLGNACAGEIIQQLGARSQKPLARLVA